MKKIKPEIVGLLQSLGVLLYCALLAGFFLAMERVMPKGPNILGWILILFLLVLSAAVTGLLVFGYPVYLALNKKVKEALKVLGYTFLYCLGIILIVVLFVVLI